MEQINKKKLDEMAEFHNQIVGLIDKTRIGVMEVLTVLEMASVTLKGFLEIEIEGKSK